MRPLTPFLLTLFFAAHIPARSQVTVRGRVIDAETQQPLEFAVIAIRYDAEPLADPHTRSTLTDGQGNFQLIVPAATDSLSISYVGYRRVCVCMADCYSCTGCYKDGHCTVSCGSPLEFRLERQNLSLSAITITPAPNAAFHTLGLIDLGLRPANSAQDLMRLVPGLFLGQHQGGGLAEHIFYRGFDADHGTDVNVSVDGMPLNLVSHVHGQGFADLHFLIPELVTKFDYGKGPYYADYGDFTTAGYVAFRTCDALDKSEIKLEGGQFNTGRVMAKVNLLGNGSLQRGENAWLSGEAAYTEGPFDRAQHLRRLNLYGKYNLRISSNTKLTATLSTFESSWRSSGEIPERAVKAGWVGRFGYIDSTQGGATGRTNILLRLRTSWPNGFLLENQAYASNYYFTLHYDPTFFAEDSIDGDQLRQLERRQLAGFNSRLCRHAYFGNGSDLLSAIGIGGQGNWIGNSELSHTKDDNRILDFLASGTPREYTVNTWLDENYRWGKWLFDLGVRLDWMYFYYRDNLTAQQPSREKWIASPKASLSYTVNPQLQFYGKIGKGFHSNDARAVIVNRGLDVLPAAYGTDLGFTWKPSPGLLLNTTVWTLYLQQEFTYDADEGTMSPGDKTLRRGIELSARYQLVSWLFANFDLDLCRARDIQAPKGANYLPLAVPLCSTGGLDFRLRNGLNGGLSYRYMKDRPASSDNSLIARGYFVTDLTVNYTRTKWEAGIEIQNLLDTQWREAQFETVSRLRRESAPVDDISFSPGTPFFAKFKVAVFF